jgi:hypothetical protein
MNDKQQKAEALDNSRPLYMWRLTDHPHAKAAVDHVFNEVVSAGLVRNDTTASGVTSLGPSCWTCTWPTRPDRTMFIGLP